MFLKFDIIWMGIGQVIRYLILSNNTFQFTENWYHFLIVE